MSWNGPVTGAASFQPPSYANGLPGQVPYGSQQTPQYGQQPGYNQYQNGFPYPHPGAPPQPPKPMPPKKKGNPIITRYPPPPGYRGPAQPQGPFGTVQYPTPQQGFSQGPSAPGPYSNQPYQGASPTQVYSPQSYGPPQNYPPQQPFSQPGYQQAQNYQWPQQPSQGYPPQPAVPQAQHYPNAPQYPQQQAGYQQYPNHPPPINTNQQAWPNAQGWQSNSATSQSTSQYSPFGGPNGHTMSEVNPYPTPSSANPPTAQPTPTSAQPQSATSDSAPGEKPPLFLGWDDWDFDFEGAIWPKANEPVDPNLSLGVITWRPAKQVTRALPATFEEAEEQSLRPPAENLGNGESVSLYFTTENSYKAFLDVRRTDEWYLVKDDPAFVVFTDEEMERNLISIEDCLALRDRPDEPVEGKVEKADAEMQDPTWNVMDNLEQALSGDMEDVKQPTPPRPSGHSLRDQAQEDILARLGVTGSPKPPSGEVISVPLLRNDQPPVSLPPKPPAPPSTSVPPRPGVAPQRAQSYGGHRDPSFGTAAPRPYGSISSTNLHQTLPVTYTGRASPWSAVSQSQLQGNGGAFASSRVSPARSEASTRTAVGSDFDAEKPTHNAEGDSGPVPSLNRHDDNFTRKRSYEDTDQEDGQTRQHDDHTKRKRRSQVDAAYSRR
ncbi:hypothetical protein BU23DRAFT_574956 [Bimuria novae-zelandiae CBS 107.79]|uniref:Uncharacterized protein n=1 Tax=Bimuria novae-zelandiae CBS 107.79 TaxID=1447943 RepID=A0A6A5UNF7_9PLEO|nr:hypothetical protein BU23DRAFT_574956 [Bimuria novae-zelandiae CBS 107.79]